MDLCGCFHGFYSNCLTNIEHLLYDTHRTIAGTAWRPPTLLAKKITNGRSFLSTRTTQPSIDGGVQLTRRAWGGLLVLCGALFLDALDVSMIGVALPSIKNDLNMSTSSLQWVVSAYVLGYGGFLLLGGRAADLLGRRRMFLISLAVFLVASGLGGLATGAT